MLERDYKHYNKNICTLCINEVFKTSFISDMISMPDNNSLSKFSFIDGAVFPPKSAIYTDNRAVVCLLWPGVTKFDLS